MIDAIITLFCKAISGFIKPVTLKGKSGIISADSPSYSLLNEAHDDLESRRFQKLPIGSKALISFGSFRLLMPPMVLPSYNQVSE